MTESVVKNVATWILFESRSLIFGGYFAYGVKALNFAP